MRTAAFFDLDDTVLCGTSLLSFYGFMAERDAREGGWLSLAELQVAAAGMRADGIARDEINAWFYRKFLTGLSVDTVKARAQAWFEDIVLAQGLLSETALAEVQRHQKEGRPCVFLTGSCTEIIAPLGNALRFSGALCAPLRVHQGRYTGDMDGPPCIGPGKAFHLAAYAKRHGIDLAGSYGYGDDLSDHHFLTALGHPCAMFGGDPGLLALARERGWNVV